MNIFILSEDAEECTKMMCDKHVVKMPTESLQMLSTIADHLGYENVPFKPVMLNHPCTIWARESQQNFSFLLTHTAALCAEYTVRYGKKHKVQTLLLQHNDLWTNVIDDLPDIGLTPFAVAISEDMNCRGIKNFNDLSAVEKYRHYYLEDKWYMAKWKTSPPTWWPKQHAENKRKKLKLLYSDTVQRLRN
jgi:hypothetical protein